MEERTDKKNITVLSNELIFQHYFMNRKIVQELFNKISIPEYMTLQMLSKENRIYFEELSKKMQMTTRQTSRLLGELKERGLILWSHDGNGSEGSYGVITAAGKKLLHEQEDILREYYGNVIEKFEKENLMELLQLMKRLDHVMDSELEKMEVKRINERADGNLC